MNVKQKLRDLDLVQRKLFKIKTKAGQISPFMPNFYQKQLNEIVKEYKRVRILALKPRQVGLSTWGVSFVAHRTMYQRHKNGLIIADDIENASGLFNMAKMFHMELPPELKPMRRYSNEKALVFDNPDINASKRGMNSQITISTAGKLSAGRSKTIQYLLASEFAYWPNAAELATGLFQSVPILDNTAIIIESTANGVTGKGAEFYNRCMKALDGDSDFDFLFFSWLDNPEYELPVPIDFKPTAEEIELIGRYPQITAAKLMFRRYKINNEMGSALIEPEDQFKQEYPLEPMEAFISSGRPVFKAETLHKMIARCPKNKRYSLKGGKLVEDDRGAIYVKEMPEPTKAYAIGADVAEGLADGDDSTFSIVCKQTMEQVAWYAGKIEPDKFGSMLVEIGKIYNQALLAPEINNHGHAVLAAIKSLGYYSVYKREVREELGQDIQDKVGWHTNTKTKMLMMDELVGAVRDGSLVVNCVSTLKEMMGLNIEDDGNITLNSKDKTVALAISLQAIKQAVAIGEKRAYVPGRERQKDVTKMTIEEKMRYYKRGGK